MKSPVYKHHNKISCVKGPGGLINAVNLYKRATFWKAKTVYYTLVYVTSRISQKICRVESLLSDRFIAKLLSKEDLSVCLTFFSCFIKQKYMYIQYLMGISVISYGFVYTIGFFCKSKY